MAEYPILFSAPMVRAILARRKTQTRRVVRRQSVACVENEKLDACAESPTGFAWQNGWVEPCQYKIGCKLWVKETWRALVDVELLDCIEYKADDKRIKPKGLTDDQGFWFTEACENIEVTHGKICRQKWRPSIYMPRWASRITLRITDVRVQRVQEISEGDAIAEGCMYAGRGDDWQRHDSYRVLWDSINAKRGFGWNINPLVWAITFKRIGGKP